MVSFADMMLNIERSLDDGRRLRIHLLDLCLDEKPYEAILDSVQVSSIVFRDNVLRQTRFVRHAKIFVHRLSPILDSIEKLIQVPTPNRPTTNHTTLILSKLLGLVSRLDGMVFDLVRLRRYFESDGAVWSPEVVREPNINDFASLFLHRGWQHLFA